jgi:2,3-bisphosphoglycerate-dependent phosphoglycerate mutase
VGVHRVPSRLPSQVAFSAALTMLQTERSSHRSPLECPRQVQACCKRGGMIAFTCTQSARRMKGDGVAPGTGVGEPNRNARAHRVGAVTIQLVFETHSITEDNESDVATGWRPGRLSKAGREQAGRMGLRRSKDGIDAVFTSDLARAVETVRIAFPNQTVPVFMDWRLRECDYGDLTGVRPDLLERAEHVDVPYPSGESWRQAAERVGWFLRDLRACWQGSRLLVVGHTATRWGLDHAINGAELETLVMSPFDWQEGWEYRVR